MNSTRKIRIAFTWAVAILIAASIGYAQFLTVKRHNTLLERGQKTVAMLTSARLEVEYFGSRGTTEPPRRTWLTTKFSDATANYEFVAGDGRTYTNSDDVDAKFIDALVDPQDDTMLKPGASIEIVYLLENPSINRNSDNVRWARRPDYMLALVGAMFAAAAAWFGSGRFFELFGRP